MKGVTDPESLAQLARLARLELEPGGLARTGPELDRILEARDQMPGHRRVLSARSCGRLAGIVVIGAVFSCRPGDSEQTPAAKPTPSSAAAPAPAAFVIPEPDISTFERVVRLEITRQVLADLFRLGQCVLEASESLNSRLLTLFALADCRHSLVGLCSDPRQLSLEITLRRFELVSPGLRFRKLAAELDALSSRLLELLSQSLSLVPQIPAFHHRTI